jgi:hypothetical protein
MGSRCRFVWQSAGIFLLIFSMSSDSHAVMISLLEPGSHSAVNSAVFYQFDQAASGSGVLVDFVRYGGAKKKMTRGYNTDGPIEYDQITGKFTRAIRLSDSPLIFINNTIYREFVFDSNESGGKNSFLSLDRIEIYLAGRGNLGDHGSQFNGSAELVYDFDAGEDNTLLIDTSIAGSGSGQIDMLMYVPDSLFTAVNKYGPNPYLYVFSEVGGLGDDLGDNMNWSNSDGFESWAVSVNGLEGGPGIPISELPEPSTFLLLSFGVFGLVRHTRRRRRRA